MIQQVNFDDFAFALGDVGEDNHDCPYSFDGLHALFDYLETFEKETDYTITFNAWEIASQYKEYDNIIDYNIEHGTNFKTLKEFMEFNFCIPIKATDGFITND
ncbi:MAG: hypothetical protein LLF82_000331 [Dehalococcoides mccartyi]|uniref:hypothetical protein n=1 Tax=Dehalococcoides mccartyi TaxID=61435 RepID=UPI00242A86E3|nr:hypothetical protein [Dehalococcoides mccartyi]MCF7634865.1 hypothetical protein [Dehalococcoides mccartyi]